MNKKLLLSLLILFNFIFIPYIYVENESKDKKSTQEAKQETKTEIVIKEEQIQSLSKNEIEEDKNKFELNFENAALSNVLNYISDLFDVTFLPDDAVSSEERKVRGVNDIKITFKTNKSYTEQQVWNFLDLILRIAEMARIQMPGMPNNFYQITSIQNSNRSNIATFVGVDPDELPDYERVRYVYFILNKQAADIQNVISRLLSKNALLDVFKELNAIILTDFGYNIKSMMQIIKSLDSTELPEVLSILKLKNADATEIVKLYESLKGKEDVFRFGEQKRGLRITQDTKVIADPRTNALILLGPKETVQRIEKFVTEHVDKSIENMQSKIHTHKLNYVPAEQIANILNAVTAFGAESEAAKFGGIREGEKYLSRMHFAADKQGNNLLIRGELEDYAIIKNIINYLDQKQPQIAAEVLIVGIDLEKTNQIDSQIRNKDNNIFNFQTSGFFGQGVQVNTFNNSGSLITNLINLAKFATQGTTVLTLGREDVFAILGILQRAQAVTIVNNPFLVITNKYSATVQVGETRRVSSSTVVGGSSPQVDTKGDIPANLRVTITPQINAFGIINLDVDIQFDNFINPQSDNPNDLRQADKNERLVKTNANVADGEVLAIGGLVRNIHTVVQGGVPILSSIPIIGSIFRNKGTLLRKQNLLVFIAPRIIRPHKDPVAPYTRNKMNIIKDELDEIESMRVQRDPINRWFFKDEDIKYRKALLEKVFEPPVPVTEKIKKQKKEKESKKQIEEKQIKEKIIQEKVQEPIKKNKSILINCVEPINEGIIND